MRCSRADTIELSEEEGGKCVQFAASAIVHWLNPDDARIQYRRIEGDVAFQRKLCSAWADNENLSGIRQSHSYSQQEFLGKGYMARACCACLVMHMPSTLVVRANDS